MTDNYDFFKILWNTNENYFNRISKDMAIDSIWYNKQVFRGFYGKEERI